MNGKITAGTFFLHENCPLVRVVEGLTCTTCGYEKVCLEEQKRQKLYLWSLGSNKPLSKTCAECGVSEKKFIYDHNNGEVVCTACGLVQGYDEAPIETISSKRGEALGNPADDTRILKFLKNRRNRHGKKFCKPK